MLHPKRRPARRAWLLALTAVLLAALIAGCGKKNETGFPGAGQGKVIATYKGGEVTQGEFDKYTTFMEFLNPQFAIQLMMDKEGVVREFALYKSFAAKATDAQLKAADQDVATFETQMNDTMKQNPQMKDQLAKKKLTVEEIKRMVKVLASGSKITAAKADEFTKVVTEADIKAEYNKNPSDFNIVTVRHILIGTVDPQTHNQLKTDEEALNLAKQVKDKLVKGGDWKALAKQYSDDTGSKENGGLYEKQEAKGWVGPFKDAANKQEIGKIGDPVQTQFGYHVMKVESRQATPFDKVPQADKNELKQAAVNAKVQKFVQDEQKALDMKVTLPPEPSPSPSALPSPSPSASAGK